VSRVILIIVSVSALFGGLTRGAGTDSASEIRAVMSAQVAAWNRGDIDGFMAGYARSANTEFVSGDKITRGWQTVRDNYRKKYDSREKMGLLKFSEIKVTPLASDAAIVLGRWQLVRRKDKPHGTFTLLFRRTPAGWRIVHDHTS
jgi:ketosteroid isomerase-like protein